MPITTYTQTLVVGHRAQICGDTLRRHITATHSFGHHAIMPQTVNIVPHTQYVFNEYTSAKCALSARSYIIKRDGVLFRGKLLQRESCKEVVSNPFKTSPG